MRRTESRHIGLRSRRFLRPGRTFWGQLVRYGFAGGIAACVNIGLYAAAWRLLHVITRVWDYQVANVVGFLAGNAVSYFLSTRYVFEFRRLRRATNEFGVYFAIGAAGLMLSALILWLLVGHLRMQRDVAKFVTVGLVFAWNFGARRVLLFSMPSGRLVAEGGAGLLGLSRVGVRGEVTAPVAKGGRVRFEGYRRWKRGDRR